MGGEGMLPVETDEGGGEACVKNELEGLDVEDPPYVGEVEFTIPCCCMALGADGNAVLP